MATALGRLRAATDVSLLPHMGGSRWRGQRLRIALAAVAVAGLVGCAECRYDEVLPDAPSVPSPPRAAPRRPVAAKEPPHRIQTAVAIPRKAEPAQPEPTRTLKPQNAARFVLVEDVEAVGRSRSFTGGQSDPNTCAEQCLASAGCDAFSFERETRLCFLVSQVTELAANASFVSGRLR